MHAIANILRKKKKHILWIVLLGGVLLLGPSLGFAQGETTDMSKTLSQLTNEIIGVASRIRVIPARVAGKLMTNSFIYGESFYLAQTLFKLRQVIRTFALFTLGFYFVGYLLYVRFNPGEGTKDNMVKLVKNTIIGGIALSMSRRLIAALIDLSLVFTSAVAGIPGQIYKETRETKTSCFSAPVVIFIGADGKMDMNKQANPDNQKQLSWDDIQPQGDNLAGPLLFFGVSVLNFVGMDYLPDQPGQTNTSAGGTQTTDNLRDISKLLVIAFVKLLFVGIMVITMIVLAIINLIRVVFLRVRIVFSPFIVLLTVFEYKGVPDGIKKYIDRKNILGLIMQPVAVIAMLSIGFIFIIELAHTLFLCKKPVDSSLIVNRESQQEYMPLGDPNSPVGSYTTINTSLSATGDLLGGISGYIIISLFVIFLLWSLIKIGTSFSELTSQYTKKITDGLEDAAGMIPIVPIPGVGPVGLSTAKKYADGGFGFDNWKNREQTTQQNIINKRVGLDDQVNVQEFITEAGRPGTSLDDLQKFIKQKTAKATIGATQAKEVVTTWLKKANDQEKRKLEALGLTNLININRTDDKAIKKLWKDNTYKKEEYMLLNRLFTHHKESIPISATDNNETTTQYGGRDKT